MSWRLIAGIAIASLGAVVAWFFFALARIAVPRANCDWSRDPHQIMCSDNGPTYWGLFLLTIAATGGALWLLNARRNRD